MLEKNDFVLKSRKINGLLTEIKGLLKTFTVKPDENIYEDLSEKSIQTNLLLHDLTNMLDKLSDTESDDYRKVVSALTAVHQQQDKDIVEVRTLLYPAGSEPEGKTHTRIVHRESVETELEDEFPGLFLSASDHGCEAEWCAATAEADGQEHLLSHEKPSELVDELVSANGFVYALVIAIKRKVMERFSWIIELFRVFSEEDVVAIEDAPGETIGDQERNNPLWGSMKKGMSAVWGFVSTWTPSVFGFVWRAVSQLFAYTSNVVKYVVSNPKLVKVWLVVAKHIKEQLCGWVSRRLGMVEYSLSTTLGTASDYFSIESRIAKDLFCLNFPGFMNKFITNIIPSFASYVGNFVNTPMVRVLMSFVPGMNIITGISSLAGIVCNGFAEDIKDGFLVVTTIKDIQWTFDFAKKFLFEDKCLQNQVVKIGTETAGNTISTDDFKKLLLDDKNHELRVSMVEKEVEYLMARDNSGRLLNFYANSVREIPFATDFMGVVVLWKALDMYIYRCVTEISGKDVTEQDRIRWGARFSKAFQIVEEKTEGYVLEADKKGVIRVDIHKKYSDIYAVYGPRMPKKPDTEGKDIQISSFRDSTSEMFGFRMS